MDGFENFRKAAREGISRAGAQPVLIEDYPSQAKSSRTACLDAVESCDAFLMIIGSRGGWTTPSGKLVVEEEYEEAKRLGLPIIIFIQNTSQDVGAEKLAKTVSDYIDGYYRKTFETHDELANIVKDSVTPIVEEITAPKMNLQTLEAKLENPKQFQSSAGLRFVIASHRYEEMIDPVDLESSELHKLLFEIAHMSDVELFEFENSKEKKITMDEIEIIEFKDTNRFRMEIRQLTVSTHGVIAIDLDVNSMVGEQNLNNQPFANMIIHENDVVNGLSKCFSFANIFFQKRDPYSRHNKFHFNVAITGLEHRQLVSELPRGNSMSLGFNRQDVVKAFDENRSVIRSDLSKPEKHINAVITLVRRRLNNS